jgi:hypothetical protein
VTPATAPTEAVFFDFAGTLFSDRALRELHSPAGPTRVPTS